MMLYAANTDTLYYFEYILTFTEQTQDFYL